MIHLATASDIPRLLEMGKRFSERARLAESVGYDAGDMAKTFAFMIEDENCCLFIGDNGTIGGQKAPHPFNHSHWIAQELFWWSEGREGLKLLTAFELWASAHCRSIRMITLEAVEPERTSKLYLHRGYAPLEHGFIKVF